jgi:hypothetical protein
MPYTPATHRYRMTYIDNRGYTVMVYNDDRQRLLDHMRNHYCSQVRIEDLLYTPQTENRNSNVQIQDTRVSTSNTDNTPTAVTTSNTSNAPAVVTTSNTDNTPAAGSSSNTGSANDDSIENLIPTSFPITTVILHLYRFIKLHPVYSTDLELYENRVLESLKKFYFKLKNSFKNNILFML